VSIALEILIYASISILFFAGGFLFAKLIQFGILKEANKNEQVTPSDYESLYNKVLENREIDLLFFEDEIIEKEQKRIAHELHDDTVQRMIAVRLRLEQLFHYTLHKGAEEDVKRLRRELDDIIATLRFLIDGLTQPRFSVKPLSYHVKGLVEKLSSMHHQKVVFEVINSEFEFPIPSKVSQELYYLVHETVHNYLKSSTGFKLTVMMRWGSELVISIKDNGQGLQRGRGFGLGMVSMKERSDRIGAELIFHSMINGLSVQIKIKNNYSQEPIS